MHHLTVSFLTVPTRHLVRNITVLYARWWWRLPGPRVLPYTYQNCRPNQIEGGICLVGNNLGTRYYLGSLHLRVRREKAGGSSVVRRLYQLLLLGILILGTILKKSISMERAACWSATPSTEEKKKNNIEPEKRMAYKYPKSRKPFVVLATTHSAREM